MTIRQIITPENEILRKKTRRVVDFKDPKLQELIDDMVETMHDAPGVGLAAPQVAENRRLIVVQLPDDEDSREEYGADAGVLYVVANPEIVKTSREKVEGIEACLSIPGYFGKVDRYVSVVIDGQDRHGKEIRIKARDWLARVFQHEIDHLDGVLYIDIAKDIWRGSERPPGVEEDEEIEEVNDEEVGE